MTKENTLELINQELIQTAMDYNAYSQLLSDLLAENKATGKNHSEAMLHYSKLNIQRMKRLVKTIELTSDLKAALNTAQNRKMIWLVITEGWCGDAAQNIPLFNCIEKQFPNIRLKLVLRDENIELMDQFLTNGGRSIPKLIALDAESFEVLGTWGPRALEAQKLYADLRKRFPENFQEVVKNLQLWYAKDKTISQQSELAELIPDWTN